MTRRGGGKSRQTVLSEKGQEHGVFLEDQLHISLWVSHLSPFPMASSIYTHFTDLETESQGVEILCLMKTSRDPDILTPESMGMSSMKTNWVNPEQHRKEKAFSNEEGTDGLKSLMANRRREMRFNLYVSKGQSCRGCMLSQDRFN